MRIAITGVSGFIGSVAARHLVEHGHQVIGLVRPTSRRDHIEPFVERFVVGDLDDESCWDDLLRGCDGVIHNGVDWEALRSDPKLHLRRNLIGSIRLLDVSAPRPFIFISSVAVHYDIRPRWDGVIDEDHPLRPASRYGAYKAAVEPHLWAAHYDEARHTCALRPCAVYGIDPTLERSHGYDLIEKIRRGQRVDKPGGGKFVHVDDVARAIVACVENPDAAGQAYNLADCYARWADWAVMAGEVLGVPVEVDLSSPPQAKNVFSKEASGSLGVELDRGHDGIRRHLEELTRLMR